MIKIINGWYYSVDEYQYILIHEYEKEKGVFGKGEKTGEMKEVKETVGYYSNLSTMLIQLTKILAKEKIDNGEIKTIEQHIKELNKIKNELESVVNPF